jgi:hypothetical protein
MCLTRLLLLLLSRSQSRTRPCRHAKAGGGLREGHCKGGTSDFGGLERSCFHSSRSAHGEPDMVHTCNPRRQKHLEFEPAWTPRRKEQGREGGREEIESKRMFCVCSLGWGLPFFILGDARNRVMDSGGQVQDRSRRLTFGSPLSKQHLGSPPSLVPLPQTLTHFFTESTPQ